MKKKTNKNKKSVHVQVSSVGVEPLGDRVLVKEIKQVETMTKSGIIIPETVGDDKGYKRGTVVAVGEGRIDDGKRIPVSVAVGDSVIFQWGDLIKVNGEEYHIVGENGILAVIK